MHLLCQNGLFTAWCGSYAADCGKRQVGVNSYNPMSVNMICIHTYVQHKDWMSITYEEPYHFFPCTCVLDISANNSAGYNLHRNHNENPV